MSELASESSRRAELASEPATRAEPADRRPDRRAVVRLARAVGHLDERRAQLTELRDLVTAIEAQRLLPADGESWLATRLQGLLDEATATAQRIAGDTATDPLAAVLLHLENLLDRHDWTVAAAAITELRQRRADQDATVRGLREDRTTYELWFSSVRDAVAAAVAAGAPLGPKDQALADGLRPAQEAAADADAGRFDVVAVAVGRARRLLAEQGLLLADGEPAATGLQERIDAIVRAGDSHRRIDERRNRKTELFLLSVPGTGPASGTSTVGYHILLRRPSFESEQESNMHSAAALRPADQTSFRCMADEIAALATQGVRALIEGTADTQPAAATRHIRVPAPGAARLDQEAPSERLLRVGRLMYGLLISDSMQRLIGESDCALTVTSNDLEVPWELMHDGEDFLCIKRAFARMPIVSGPRRTRPPRTRPRTPWRVLLIHSDPNHSDPARRLVAAEREVDAIAERLRGLVPEENIRILRPAAADVDTITRHLGSGDYDVIHYAGHAGFDAADSAQSHLLLRENEKFSAERIEKVLEGRPVVFLNACDTSRFRNAEETVALARAQGLASAFVYGGAHACVGSLWPVFDDTARDFAVSFYDRLFHRQRIGQALAEARRQSRATNTDKLTWASYALYGDPLYRLRDAPSPAPSAPGRDPSRP